MKMDIEKKEKKEVPNYELLKEKVAQTIFEYKTKSIPFEINQGMKSFITC